MMMWIDKNKNYWRIAILVLLLAAFLGPWGYDLIVVPVEYAEDACSSPNVWLEGDYCGMPFRGTLALAQWIPGPVYFVVGLLTGESNFSYGNPIVFITLNLIIPSLILLPFIATLLLIRGRESRTRQVARVVVWSLAAGASTLFLLTHALRMGNFSWIVLLRSKLWGSWLYIALAGIVLAVEIFVWRKGSELSKESEP
jgi:hypothetical protein